MAQLHFVKKARKTIRGTGIKKGDSYWFFKHFRGAKHVSKTKPPRSAYLTTSPFIAAMMDAEDEADRIPGSLKRDSPDDEERETGAFKILVIVSRVSELGDECQTKLDSVSEAFPNGCPTIDLLESRVSACETIAQELENAAAKIDEETTIEEIQSLIDGISWSYE